LNTTKLTDTEKMNKGHIHVLDRNFSQFFSEKICLSTYHFTSLLKRANYLPLYGNPFSNVHRYIIDFADIC